MRSGRATCWRCGKPIDAVGEWHLGHYDDGSHAGPEHASCNLKDGGRKRAAQLYGKAATTAEPAMRRRWSRHWFGAFDERCPVCQSMGAPCPDAMGESNA